MRRGIVTTCAVSFFLGFFGQPVNTQDMLAIDKKLINWMQGHRSPVTYLPLSFQVLPEHKSMVYQKMGQPNDVDGIIERIIVEEGMVIYDAAVGQIALSLTNEKKHLALASHPLEIYWQGQIGELNNIRAGYPRNMFIYDPQHPQHVSSDLAAFGQRGFIFRILNAHGRYNTRDPLDGKTICEFFPTWPTVHWEDWRPIAGENAWVVIAAMHLFHKKYYNPEGQFYNYPRNATELLLAEELARSAMILQAENGGIRMAPLGTHKTFIEPEKSDEDNRWWYEEISTENNLSWYAAFRMLHQVTGKSIYQWAMDKIEIYLQGVWNPQGKYFYQGMHWVQGHWIPNTEHFATDVQTWAIAALGPEQIDEWFAEGASYRLWQVIKNKTGFYGAKDRAGSLLGVGFTNEHDRLSVEWTAGAILAARRLGEYYRERHFPWAQEAFRDAQTMREGVEGLRYELSDLEAAYAYSSRRGWIPFGWNSHDPRVLSLAATAWVVLVDAQGNPFYLPQHTNEIHLQASSQNSLKFYSGNFR